MSNYSRAKCLLCRSMDWNARYSVFIHCCLNYVRSYIVLTTGDCVRVPYVTIALYKKNLKFHLHRRATGVGNACNKILAHHKQNRYIYMYLYRMAKYLCKLAGIPTYSVVIIFELEQGSMRSLWLLYDWFWILGTRELRRTRRLLP